MPIIDDDIGRRRFLSQAVMGFGLVFGVGTLALRFFQFLMPASAAKRPEAVLIAGAPQLPVGEARPMDLGGHKIMVLRTDEGIVAFSRRCTDLGCLVSWSREREQFLCPCHLGVFDKTGRNIAGPPPRPLDRYDVTARGGQFYVHVQTSEA